jgi:ABC-2 type transport system permease protein
MDTLRRILVLCRKEFLAILKDPRSRFVLIGPVVVQSLIFGYAATYDLNRVPYALLDLDRSAASQELVGRIEGSGTFRRVADLSTPHQIAASIDGKDALLVLQIGQNFERDLESGRQAVLQLVVDGRNSNTAGTASRYVATIVEEFNADWRRAHGGGDPPLAMETRAWYNPNLETRWNMVPGLIAVLSMLQTLILTALSVAREREQGTFDQLLVTPLRPVEIMVGKAVPSIVIGLIQATIILTVAWLWFQIPFEGSLIALYTALLMFTVASVGIGLAVSALAVNMQQAMLYTFVLLMPMVLLSGFTSPIRNMPQIMQYITLIDPLRYGVEMVQRIYLEGVSLAWVINDLWPLLIIAGVTLPSAAWLFRHRLV